MITATSFGTPYVEIDEKAIECSFRSWEFVNAMYVKEGAKIPVPKQSEVTHSGIRQVPSKGARVEKGLGKRLQGMLKPIAAIQKKDRFGVGTNLTRKEDKDSWRRKDRAESPAFSGKRRTVQE